ncbi:hypothetical protein V1511DRAFT_509743 [Dipodascopsis uninucleata]
MSWHSQWPMHMTMQGQMPNPRHPPPSISQNTSIAGSGVGPAVGPVGASLAMSSNTLAGTGLGSSGASSIPSPTIFAYSDQHGSEGAIFWVQIGSTFDLLTAEEALIISIVFGSIRQSVSIERVAAPNDGAGSNVQQNSFYYTLTTRVPRVPEQWEGERIPVLLLIEDSRGRELTTVPVTNFVIDRISIAHNQGQIPTNAYRPQTSPQQTHQQQPPQLQSQSQISIAQQQQAQQQQQIHSQSQPQSGLRPLLVRSSTMGPGGPSRTAVRASVRIESDLDSLTRGWTGEELRDQRRLVRFVYYQDSAVVHVAAGALSQADYGVQHRQHSPMSTRASISSVGSPIIESPHMQHAHSTMSSSTTSHSNGGAGECVISCIYWAERGEYVVTSVDCITLLEQLVSGRFSVEEKNRIRRNLEGYRPQTVSKGKRESEAFFRLIMGYPSPKPRNIEKDVKVFQWRILAGALKKIVGKYSAIYDNSITVPGPTSSGGRLPSLVSLPPLMTPGMSSLPGQTQMYQQQQQQQHQMQNYMPSMPGMSLPALSTLPSNIPPGAQSSMQNYQSPANRWPLWDEDPRAHDQ